MDWREKIVKFMYPKRTGYILIMPHYHTDMRGKPKNKVVIPSGERVVEDAATSTTQEFEFN